MISKIAASYSSMHFLRWPSLLSFFSSSTSSSPTPLTQCRPTLQDALRQAAGRRYLLALDRGVILIALHRHAAPADMLRAWFHGELLRLVRSGAGWWRGFCLVLCPSCSFLHKACCFLCMTVVVLCCVFARLFPQLYVHLRCCSWQFVLASSFHDQTISQGMLMLIHCSHFFWSHGT